MKVIVRPLRTTQGNSWQVCMDQHAVSFRSEAEAQRFVATLEARLKAPHVLPEPARRVAS